MAADPVDGIAEGAPALAGWILSAQRWTDLTFLHWPVDPARVAPYFPAGTEPDVIDGVSYVGLVPFQMRSAGPGARLPVRYFGDFAETNVRLYSVDDAGRHGIVFRSLETQRLGIVALTRLGLGLNYTWSQMLVSRYRDVLSYESRRRWPERGLRSRITVRIGEQISKPDELQRWLTARWGLHTSVGGRTLWVPNEHAPWPLYTATVLDCAQDLLQAAGTAPVGEMLPAMFSPGVSTRFGGPRRVLGTDQSVRGLRSTYFRKVTPSPPHSSPSRR